MTQRVLDVSTLPQGAVDSRALLWWGNLGMMVIEGTMFAMMIATYFYLRVVNLDWPPATVPTPPIVWPTVNLALMAIIVIPARVADRAALRDNVPLLRIGMILCVLLGVAMLAIRSYSFTLLGYKWSDHAYGSVIWTIHGLHTFHLLAATSETALLVVYSLVRPVVKKQLLDIRSTAVYWYFVVIVWIPFYFIVWIAPFVRRKG